MIDEAFFRIIERVMSVEGLAPEEVGRALGMDVRPVLEDLHVVLYASSGAAGSPVSALELTVPRSKTREAMLVLTLAAEVSVLDVLQQYGPAAGPEVEGDAVYYSYDLGPSRLSFETRDGERITGVVLKRNQPS